ncbi:hypothetical protein [Aquibacillus kalidii]|uniref:hypothetical protein n=1 Tax=Aquibacillus kalidii TaxID=2762597 RepID=UPI001645774F|nr:hypothetical protein [Aquibacillus kalidii]
MGNKKKNQTAENIKETAGAAFHNVHSALETTENAAMEAVDVTAEAVEEITNDSKKNRNNK